MTTREKVLLASTACLSLTVIVLSLVVLVLLTRVSPGLVTSGTTPASPTSPGLVVPPTPPAAIANRTTVSASNLPPVGARIVARGMALTVEQVIEPASSAAYSPAAGNKLVLIQVLIENLAMSAPAPTAPIFFHVVDSQQRNFESTLVAVTPQVPVLVPRGQRSEGWLTFEVPESAAGLSLLYGSPVYYPQGSRIPDENFIRVDLGH